MISVYLHPLYIHKHVYKYFNMYTDRHVSFFVSIRSNERDDSRIVTDSVIKYLQLQHSRKF